MVVLIGLPVMGIATAALVLETAVPTPQERAIRTMGQADLRVTPIGSFGRARLVASLPTGSSIQPMWATGDRVVLPGTRLTTSVLFTDLHDLASGMATLLEGRLPEAVDEVAISTALATRAGVSLGGTLDLDAQGRVRVVGLVEDPRDLSRALVLGAPALADAPDQWPVWLVRLPDGVDAQSVAADLARAVDTGDADTGQQMFDVETREQAGAASETFVTIVITLGALALVELALVASAAFAVGIRRRQRELGLLGAVGTTPRQMAGSVLAEGLLAGAVAVILGIVLGLASAWLISLRLDELTGQRTGSLVVDPMALLLAALVGLAAAIIAAAVPAWGAARLPTLVALSGRRPPVTPARRLLALGIALILVALACTLGGAHAGRLQRGPAAADAGPGCGDRRARLRCLQPVAAGTAGGARPSAAAGSPGRASGHRPRADTQRAHRDRRPREHRRDHRTGRGPGQPAGTGVDLLETRDGRGHAAHRCH